MIQFLADENISTQIVAWLRGRGDDVRFAAEEAPGEPDTAWLRQAEDENRLLLTSDNLLSAGRAVNNGGICGGGVSGGG